jgi:hypothetical protein
MFWRNDSIYSVIRIIDNKSTLEGRFMFTIYVSQDQDRVALFERAKLRAKEKGLRLAGCVASGEFSGKGVEGTYKTEGDELRITITKRPFYIPEKAIRAKLMPFFD